MATNLVSDGEILVVAAPAAVSSGDFVVVGSIFGVAMHDAENTADVAIATRGIYTFTKTEEQAWAVGAPIYWDSDPGEMTTTSTDNTLVGVATAVAADPSLTGQVRLSGAF